MAVLSSRATNPCACSFAALARRSRVSACLMLFWIQSLRCIAPTRTVLRRKRHLALLRSEVEEKEGSPAPDDLLLSEEKWVQVRAALEALNPRDREVLLLWDAGLSYREIAEVTDLAAGAIGTTLARARRRLVEAHGEMEKENAARN